MAEIFFGTASFAYEGWKGIVYHERYREATFKVDYCPVDRGRIDAVPIVEDEPVGRLGGDDRAELLDRPLRRGMLRDVPVEDPTRADLEDDEDIEDAEADGHRREEVTGDDRVRMIPHKRRPPLGPLPTAPGPQRPEIPSDRAR